MCAAGFGLLAYVYLTLPDVRELAKENPTTTAFMEMRAREAAREGESARRYQQWVPYSRISQNLKRAVLVAEDDLFWQHEGIDIEQIRKSIQLSLEDGTSIRGASTITQQLAKNLYLSPSRDPVRKLRELIVTRRLEAELSKVRIFEIYLNVIEWGDGIWGAEAAARTYFGVSAAALEPDQAALLAGAIINPRVYSPARPNARLRARQRLILSRMGGVALSASPRSNSVEPDRPSPPEAEVAAPPEAEAGDEPPSPEAPPVDLVDEAPAPPPTEPTS